MKRWSVLVCTIILAGCSGPQISVTDATPRRVGFLVRNAWMVPMQDIDEQAASYCQEHGLSSRRADTVWIAATLKRVAYECDGAEQAPTRKQKGRRQAVPKPAAEDPKAAAWTKAKAATDVWALCLRFDAERRARESAEPPRAIAQKAVDSCAGLEHAVHEPLQAVGEDSGGFEADMHAQAVQNASDVVTSARVKTGLKVSGSPAF